MSFAACWVIQKEPGVLHAVAGIIVTMRQGKFGWTTSIALVMNAASQNVVMVDGGNTTAGTVKMWEWSANTHQNQHQVQCGKVELFLLTCLSLSNIRPWNKITFCQSAIIKTAIFKTEKIQLVQFLQLLDAKNNFTVEKAKNRLC